MKKIITFYLPQFHHLEINDKLWGEGFTEWDNLKKGTILEKGQYQPRIPLDGNYYDLSDVNVMRNQVKLAKKYGIYGFCFYHYWFDDQPLMQLPLENFLADHSLDLPFCFSWANESWTNGWARADFKVVLRQTYGDKEQWKKHFDFLLPYFKDDRYIKEDNKPLFIIYRPYLFENICEMMKFWHLLAIESGFNGIKFVSQRFENPRDFKEIYDFFDYHIEYQPAYSLNRKNNQKKNFQFFKNSVYLWLLKKINMDFTIKKINKKPIAHDYDSLWHEIINSKPLDRKSIAGGFVDWDNTPRHGNRGSFFKGVTPEKFGYYLTKQLAHIDTDYYNDYLFLFAWNEWGEGGYLEPDELYKFSFLEQIHKALIENQNSK